MEVVKYNHNEFLKRLVSHKVPAQIALSRADPGSVNIPVINY